MSAWKAFRKQLDIVQRTERLMARGAILQKPKWFDIMKAVPPTKPWEIERAARKVTFPEEGLLQRFYRRNPHALQQEVYDPDDPSSKPLAFRFVGLQLKYMKQQGLSEHEAYERVKRELDSEMKARGVSEPGIASARREDAAEASNFRGSGRSDPASISLRDKFREWSEAEREFFESKAKSNKK